MIRLTELQVAGNLLNVKYYILPPVKNIYLFISSLLREEISDDSNASYVPLTCLVLRGVLFASDSSRFRFRVVLSSNIMRSTEFRTDRIRVSSRAPDSFVVIRLYELRNVRERTIRFYHSQKVIKQTGERIDNRAALILPTIKIYMIGYFLSQKSNEELMRVLQKS